VHAAAPTEKTAQTAFVITVPVADVVRSSFLEEEEL
jgi:hypothetical protein